MDFGTNQILITGANGWLGKSLVYCLLNGIENSVDIDKPNKNLKIKCLVLKGEDTSLLQQQSKNITIINGDITDIDACRRLVKNSKRAILFHCAGIIHPKKTRQFFDINVIGTRNILNAAVKGKIKKMVIVSSNSPCGTNPNNNHLFDENYGYNPYMEYGRSKMEMEKLINRSYLKGQMETVIIRPPWFYGPFQPDRQKLFFEMIRNGKAPIIGGGDNKRSMTYTENLVQGMVLAATNNIASGRTYWVADENPYTMNEIVNTIEDLLVNEFRKECDYGRMRLPGFVSSVAEISDRILQSIGLYHQKIHVLSEMNKNIACSINKAKDDLGYAPEYSLKTGMLNSLKEIYN